MDECVLFSHLIVRGAKSEQCPEKYYGNSTSLVITIQYCRRDTDDAKLTIQLYSII